VFNRITITLNLVTLCVLCLGCSMNGITQNKDFRSDTIYKNTELIFDAPKGESKGTVLLIHGTAPQNIDGRIPIDDIQKYFRKTDPFHYALKNVYKELSENLNQLGWNTVRYTRLGVYNNKVDVEEYGKTDLKNIVDQLKSIWLTIPNNKPKIAFAWSGGSIHILQLPLKEADAIVILGGISTKRTDVYKLSVKTSEQQRELDNYLSDVFAKKAKVSRTAMLSNDMPFGRFFDEDDLNENWTYLKEYSQLPVLILHGNADTEVSLSQASVWKDKLPHHRIDVIIKRNGNHAYGTTGNAPDMKDLAETMNRWLSTVLLPKTI